MTAAASLTSAIRQTVSVIDFFASFYEDDMLSVLLWLAIFVNPFSEIITPETLGLKGTVSPDQNYMEVVLL
jgi:hypothetical protein